MREQENSIFNRQRSNEIEDVCFEKIVDTLNNWSEADVRTVPNVMYQIRCGSDKNDQTIEYQLNWFIDCAETYIHNHRNSFLTYCLEGQYEEKIWKILHNNDGTVTYLFTRTADNQISCGEAIAGTLTHVDSRQHFPGNIMYVDTKSFHSVTPTISSNKRVLTFLIKKKCLEEIDTYVLSSESHFEQLNDQMRPANDHERQQFYQKLIQILTTNYYQQLTEENQFNLNSDRNLLYQQILA